MKQPQNPPHPSPIARLRRIYRCLAAVPIAATLLLAPAGAAKEGLNFRPAQTSERGVVSSISDYSSAVGIDVLNRGGNAVDAAVAMAFAVGVARPEMGGIGGGGFLVLRTPSGETAALDFREAAPAAVTPITYLRGGMHKDEDDAETEVGSGHMIVGVPGTVAGMAEVLRRFGSGRFTLGQLISSGAAPLEIPQKTPYAYELARDGVRVTFGLARSLFNNETRLAYYPETKRIYHLESGVVYGTFLVQSDYAKSLALIAKHGADAFYKDAQFSDPVTGLPRDSIARLIAADMADAYAASRTNSAITDKWNSAEEARDIGLLTLNDLQSYRPIWRKPVVGTYRRSSNDPVHEIIGMPPPSAGGIVTVEMLNILEGFGLDSNSLDPALALNAASSWAQSSANHLHVLAEAQKIAWDDRNKYIGDPAFVGVPAKLTHKHYATKRREEIKLDPASSAPLRAGEKSNTNHLSVMDAQGMAVAVTTSLDAMFGSAVVAPGTGFLLNSELHDFNMGDSEDPSKPGPGTANEPNGSKRPRSSQTPTIVVRNGKPVLVAGGSGGSSIPLGVIQTIVNMVAYRLDLAHAIDAERIEATLFAPALGIEDLRVADAAEDELTRRRHQLKRLNVGADPVVAVSEYYLLPIINAVGFNLTTGRNEAVADPRNEIEEDPGQGAAAQ